MPQRPEIKVQLIHLQGPYKGEIQDFIEDRISIGRHPSSTLCFPKDLTIISRKHAEIAREGNRFKLVDHSTNGTYVNGKPINETYLKNGDVLTFAEGGPKVSFLMETLSSGRSEESSPKPEAAPKPPSSPRAKEEGNRSSSPGPEAREAPSQPRRVKAPLIVQYGPTLRSYTELPVTIGSGRQCDFQIDHPSLLAQHARISFSGDTYWIEDLSGQSRVAVNQRAISGPTALQAQDAVALNRDGPFFIFLGGGRLAEAEEEP